MKKVSKANKIIVIISIILLLAIACIIGYKYYDTHKDDNSIFIINKVNKLLHK